jgi:adenosylmethionine-8-amino-7-oxononanoate aminotransferase
MQQAGIAPDLVCLSKGLTAGYLPMAATVASEKVFESFTAESFDKALPHGHSFTGNPLASAVALASLDLFEEEKTLAKIARIEARHREMLPELRARDDVARPRVLGTVLAFDLKGAGGYQSARSQSLKDWFLANGLNIRPLGTTVYLMPPYCITDAELGRAYAGMLQGLDWLASNAGSTP